MNIFNVKWGIHICVSITRATKYFLSHFFNFLVENCSEKPQGLTSHVYQIIFSSNLDDSQE